MARCVLYYNRLARLAGRFWGNISKQWADRLGVGGPPSLFSGVQTDLMGRFRSCLRTTARRRARHPHLTSRAPRTWVLRMNLPDDEHAFLKELVKASRQKPHHVTWTDRDGTERRTTLTQPEVVRLNAIAQRLKISKSNVLRQAAHIPVAK